MTTNTADTHRRLTARCRRISIKLHQDDKYRVPDARHLFFHIFFSDYSKTLFRATRVRASSRDINRVDYDNNAWTIRSLRFGYGTARARAAVLTPRNSRSHGTEKRSTSNYRYRIQHISTYVVTAETIYVYLGRRIGACLMAFRQQDELHWNWRSGKITP